MSQRFVLGAAALGVITLPLTAAAFDPSAAAPLARWSQEERTCIAIVLPSVHGVEGNAVNVASAIRELLASYLTGPSLQTVALEARLAAQAIEEARQKSCGRILFTTVTEKRAGSGGFGKALGQAANASSWYVPGGATVGSAAARAAVSASLQTVASLAATTKAKDEFRFEYTVQGANGQTQLGPAAEQAKAKVDGEDLLTPLVEKVAGAVAAAPSKGKE